MEDETLGSRIRRLRTELGFTIHHLAVAILVTPDAIQKLENDDFSEVPRAWLAKISALTGHETGQVVGKSNVHYYDPGRQVYVLHPKLED